MPTQANEIPKPATYRHPQAPLALLAPLGLLGLLGLLIVGCMIAVARLAPKYVAYPAPFAVIAIAIILLLAARTIYIWRNPYKIDPDTGNISRKIKMNLLLAVFGSREDLIEMDGAAQIITPSSELVTKYLNSTTLVVDATTIPYLRNIDHVMDIVAYRRSLKTRELNRAERQVELLEEICDLLREINDRLLSEKRTQDLALEPLSLDDKTGEIPVVTFDQDRYPPAQF